MRWKVSTVTPEGRVCCDIGWTHHNDRADAYAELGALDLHGEAYCEHPRGNVNNRARVVSDVPGEGLGIPDAGPNEVLELADTVMPRDEWAAPREGF